MNSDFLSAGVLYLGKMMVISAVLYGYYRAFLRNATFHPFNRWYLLGSVLLALALPLMRIPLPSGWPGGEPFAGIFTISPASAGPDELAPVTLTGSAHGFFYGLFRGLNLLYILYTLVAGILFFVFLRSFYYLMRLLGKYASTRVEGIRFSQTEEPGTPFSFLNRLFWNRELPLDTAQGWSIFRHECYHIRQRHTLDILALEIVRSLFWCNPFFHLVLREIKVVHEFLADRYALSAAGPKEGVPPHAYAEWLVWQSVHAEGGPKQLQPAGVRSAITHSFFHTHLKRRITMIIQSNHHRPRRMSRVMVLPLLFLLFCAFVARKRTDPFRSASSRAIPVKEAGKPSINDLVRFYLHRLRYPEAAIKGQQEEIIWFSVTIGEKNKLVEFKPFDVAQNPIGQKAYEITVTGRAALSPSDTEGGAAVNGENRKEVFLDEARAASEKISSETSHTYIPGKYLFTIIFRLEKPAMKEGKPVASNKKAPIAFRLDQSGDLDQKISQEPN